MPQRVEFWGDLGKLVGHLRLPESASATPRPCVVLCAGMSLTKEVWLPAHAEQFVAAGFATLNFDYSTFGESDGQPRCRLHCAQQVRDTQAAISYVASLPEVDAARIALYGVSLGASVAIATAGRDRRVRAAVAVAGPMDLHRVWRGFDGFDAFAAKVARARTRFTATGEVSYIAVPRLLASDPETAALLQAEAPKYPTWRQEVSFESLADLFAFRPEEEAPHARGALLFVYPEKDELIARFEMQSAYSRAGGPAKLVALKGAHHVDVYKREGAFDEVVTTALAWYRRYVTG
jgi:uncharacterized protein